MVNWAHPLAVSALHPHNDDPHPSSDPPAPAANDTGISSMQHVRREMLHQGPKWQGK
jgi:hypothetical protein